MQTRQFKKIEIKPKPAPTGCNPGDSTDPDAPPC